MKSIDSEENPLNRSTNCQTEQPFWKAKTLDEMTATEWESLCDGCGRCCLNKLEDYDSGEIVWTDVACTLLDGETCRCKNYVNRALTVPDCIQLTVEEVHEITWLPPTCAYRLVRDGEDLYWWHPLVSGSSETVHEAGVSVRGRTVSEDGVEVEEYEHHVVDWPNVVPEGSINQG
ncbi:MAG: YcgN family cysteine cluster protein [Rhodobacteraceae bacterium]|nr:YcgN family cysteine cluster protein [Paracoccaceae bacterium]